MQAQAGAISRAGPLPNSSPPVIMGATVTAKADTQDLSTLVSDVVRQVERLAREHLAAKQIPHVLP
jgi:hypothetical protein